MFQHRLQLGAPLPAGRGEHADSMPSLGNGVKGLSLIN
jgi:hypothetical protein